MQPLDDIRVAAPCTVSWDDMEGDDRVRHCFLCRLNVYNLSSMTRDEAEALVRKQEGRLCVRYYRRNDGTVLTADCPEGAARRRRIKSRLLTIALGLFAATLATLGFERVGGYLASLVGRPEPTCVLGGIAPPPGP